MPSKTESTVMAAMRAAVQRRGLSRLAADLATSPATLGSFFAGTARAGTALLLETRFRELEQREAGSVASPEAP